MRFEGSVIAAWILFHPVTCVPHTNQREGIRVLMVDLGFWEHIVVYFKALFISVFEQRPTL